MKPIDKNPHDQGDRIAASAKHRQAVRADFASQIVEAEREVERQPYVTRTVSEETYQTILNELANGELLYLSCKRHNVSIGLFYNRARKDEEFAERFRQARVDMVLTRMDHTFLIAAGVEGFSTGCEKRDALLVKVTQNFGKAFAPEYFQDRVAHRVEHSIAPVMLSQSDVFAPRRIEDASYDVIDDPADD